MSEQPKALALADKLESCGMHVGDSEQADAADELRRQHAEIERLRDALTMAVRQNDHDMLMTGDELRMCRAALERKP